MSDTRNMIAIGTILKIRSGRDAAKSQPCRLQSATFSPTSPAGKLYIPMLECISTSMSVRSIEQVAAAVSLRNVNNRCSRRYFTSSVRGAQQQAGGPHNGRTTHFGFETVPESDKESKGWSRRLEASD